MRTLYCANDISHDNFSLYRYVENDGKIENLLNSDCSYEGTCGCFVCDVCISQGKSVKDCYAICTQQGEHYKSFGIHIDYNKLITKFIENHLKTDDNLFIEERKDLVFQMFMKLKSNEDISFAFWESLYESPRFQEFVVKYDIGCLLRQLD